MLSASEPDRENPSHHNQPSLAAALQKLNPASRDLSHCEPRGLFSTTGRTADAHPFGWSAAGCLSPFCDRTGHGSGVGLVRLSSLKLYLRLPQLPCGWTSPPHNSRLSEDQHMVTCNMCPTLRAKGAIRTRRHHGEHKLPRLCLTGQNACGGTAELRRDTNGATSGFLSQLCYDMLC